MDFLEAFEQLRSQGGGWPYQAFLQAVPRRESTQNVQTVLAGPEFAEQVRQKINYRPFERISFDLKPMRHSRPRDKQVSRPPHRVFAFHIFDARAARVHAELAVRMALGVIHGGSGMN